MKQLAAVWIGLILVSCQSKKQDVVVQAEDSVEIDLSSIGKEKLSNYGYFTGPLKNLSPAEGVVAYSLNSGLFSDYAYKKRFVRIPTNKRAIYSREDVFDFPEGTALIKNFYYPADFRKPSDNLRIIETRLLLKEGGQWKTLTYLWNKEQTDAYLNVAGKNVQISWKHYDGKQREVNYVVPNQTQCRGCHMRGDRVMPIGPSARQLNGPLEFSDSLDNQLVRWRELHLLEGAPPVAEAPFLPAYGNENEPVDRRARAWLEINCAHCHREDGPAKNSGLHLLASVKDPLRLGIGKAPVAAGKGSGGLLYGIVPGKPEESILQFRIESTHPGVMMPELGRTIVHEEGVALVREWIREMKL